jgi:hypothetical protein
MNVQGLTAVPRECKLLTDADILNWEEKRKGQVIQF